MRKAPKLKMIAFTEFNCLEVWRSCIQESGCALQRQETWRHPIIKPSWQRKREASLSFRACHPSPDSWPAEECDRWGVEALMKIYKTSSQQVTTPHPHGNNQEPGLENNYRGWKTTYGVLREFDHHEGFARCFTSYRERMLTKVGSYIIQDSCFCLRYHSGIYTWYFQIVPMCGWIESNCYTTKSLQNVT